MGKNEVEYCVEFRRENRPYYGKSFSGFSNVAVAMEVAENSAKTGINARVVEQKRKVLKVFKAVEGLGYDHD